jgi:alpha-1,2-mannosyltransferase
MANSSWTKNHIDDILRHSDTLLDVVHFLPSLLTSTLVKQYKPVKAAQIVYPPCDTSQFSNLPLTGRERVVLSVAQFR